MQKLKIKTRIEKNQESIMSRIKEVVIINATKK